MVLLSVLASKISLRCSRLRYKGSRLLRVDTVRGFRSWQPDRRMVLELSASPRLLAGFFAQDGTRRQCCVDAMDLLCATTASRSGDRRLQHRLFRTTVLVHAGDDSSGRPFF